MLSDSRTSVKLPMHVRFQVYRKGVDGALIVRRARILVIKQAMTAKLAFVLSAVVHV